MLVRSVFLFTHSFITPRPYGGVLVMLAVVNSFLTIRFVHKYSCCFEVRKHRGATTLSVLLLMAAELLLAFNPYYNSAGGLVLLLQIAANARVSGNAQKQHAFVGCYVSHTLLTVYYSLCDGNIFRVQPVQWAGNAIIGSLVLQLIVLLVQEHKRELKKLVFRRGRSTLPPELVGSDCPICLSPLQSPLEVIVTECKHVFHQSCLLTWTTIRGVCPLDRRVIGKELLED